MQRIRAIRMLSFCRKCIAVCLSEKRVGVKKRLVVEDVVRVVGARSGLF